MFQNRIFPEFSEWFTFSLITKQPIIVGFNTSVFDVFKDTVQVSRNVAFLHHGVSLVQISSRFAISHNRKSLVPKLRRLNNFT